MPAPKGWNTNPSGGLAVNPLIGWDLIGTTDSMNPVVRLEFATEQKERETVRRARVTSRIAKRDRPRRRRREGHGHWRN